MADGNCPPVLSMVGPHIIHDPSIGQFNERRFVGLLPHDTPEFPGLSMIVRKDDVRTIRVLLRILMIAMVTRYHQTTAVRTASQLDSLAGPGRVPTPMRFPQVGHLLRIFPSDAVVITERHVTATGKPALPRHDFSFVI